MYICDTLARRLLFDPLVSAPADVTWLDHKLEKMWLLGCVRLHYLVWSNV